ncbi:MAG: DUF1501 domain-containing protein [Pseudomonadales bacterium]|nr:DUF1501 domain-containing protein [Pseudomonadales bacterium]
MTLTRRELFMGKTSTKLPSTRALFDDKDVLVCIFQRGGADGLNSVVPYGDENYSLHRGAIQVPEPGEENGAIDLTGFYGLHPALSPLKSIYDAGDLALVHAVGVPHGSRSHFAAQGLVERGVDDKAGPTNGWLGRHMSLSEPPGDSAFRTVSISGNVPLMLLGAQEPLAISNLTEFGFEQSIIDSGYTEVLANLFRQTVPFSSPAQAALGAIDELQVANLSQYSAENGAAYPSSDLGKKIQQAAQLIKSELPVEAVCLDSDGWDHHENLPTSINASLGDLADCLSAFYTDMGSRMANITVLVHTEFGRRVAANASSGVDHGTAGVAYLMGGGVNGGQVAGTWPGLAEGDLEQGEDLAISTDLRSVIAEMLSKRLGGTTLSSVFPEFEGGSDLNLFSSR